MRRGRFPSLSVYATQECDSRGGGGWPWVTGISHNIAFELALSSSVYRSFRYLQREKGHSRWKIIQEYKVS